jgi:pimeloyl-ACP methyl ester carboxylesterase
VSTEQASQGLHTTAIGDVGQRVVFLHGLFGQGRNWTQIAKAFSSDHRTLLVDLPHHGRSPWEERFDFLDIADQVAALFRVDDPVTLVGHSMGGKVAMILALRHPDLVARLVVVDVSPVGYGTVSEFAGYIAAMQQIDLGALTQRSDADVALTEAVPHPTVRSFLLQNLRREGEKWRWQVNLDVLGADLAEVSGWPDEQLASCAPYAGPVLWIAGARSAYVRDEYAGAMDRWFPHTRKVTIKNAGHWVHSEQPDVFVQVLRQFLD